MSHGTYVYWFIPSCKGLPNNISFKALCLLEKFLRRVQTLCVALRTTRNSPVPSNNVINYAIAIYAYFEQCCVIISKTFPGTIVILMDFLQIFLSASDEYTSLLWK